MIGMALVAPDGRWLRANRALCALLGYPEEELRAVGFRPLIERDEAAVGGDMLARLLAGDGADYEIAQRFVTGRGYELYLHLHISLVRDAASAPDYLIVQVRDLTAQREAERERDLLLAQLRRSNEELERFAAVASHDLQEPLRKIRAFGDRLVATEEGRLSERGRDYLARMHQAAARMQDLIGGLLSYSRLSSKPPARIPVALGPLIAEVLRDLDGQLGRTGGRVTAERLPTVHGDPLQLRQLFQNLVGNALKFHRPDVPPVVIIEAVAADASAASDWQIAVRDNGIGFEERYREQIFGIFQRLHGRAEFEGSGLGLALCQRIVEQHGGTITAHGQPGVGATFTFTLPAVTGGDGV
jgi:PAS domain S-box-containing protein